MNNARFAEIKIVHNNMERRAKRAGEMGFVTVEENFIGDARIVGELIEEVERLQEYEPMWELLKQQAYAIRSPEQLQNFVNEVEETFKKKPTEIKNFPMKTNTLSGGIAEEAR